MAHSLTDDVLPALADALSAEAGTAAALTLAAGVLIGLAVGARRLGPRARRGVFLGVVALAIGVGLTLAWRRLWLCDDAFISFRYARNLAQGHGLVFNPGEWVEGYTNFLWTAVLGVLGKIGLDIPLTALALNLASFGAAVALTAGVVRRTAPGTVTIPLAALALGGSLGFTTFASSGLETMPAAALVMAGVLYAGRPLLSGSFLILAALTRPDHLLFWGCMGLAMAGTDVLTGSGAWLKRLQWRRYLAFTAPLVFVFVPWFLWRWHAYGDVFPNTYYAKSGGSSYYSQGVIYLAVWVLTSGAWLWLPLLGLLAIARPRSPAELRLRLFALLGVAIYGHYVVRVGGDFMMERFFIVLWPIALAAVEVQVRWLRGTPRLLALPVAAVALGVTTTPVRPIPDFQKVWHLAAEHSFYRIASLSPLTIESRYFRIGQQLGEAFAAHGPYPRLAAGSVGLLGYYSGLPISDRYGLTSRRVAHKPILSRGRPGHEKQAAMEDLQAEGADIALHNLWGAGWKPWTEATIGGARVYLLRDQPALRAAFAGDKRLRLPPRPLSAIQRSARRLRRAEALDDWRFLRSFMGEAEELGPLVVRLGAIADFEEGLPPGLQVEGKAPAWLTDEHPPLGATGEGWLELDGPGQRHLALPLNLDGAREVRLALGGSPVEGHRVELWSGGRLIDQARPTGGRLLRPAALHSDVPLYQAELRIIDDEDRPGTVLLVDALHVPGPRDLRVLLKTPGATAYRVAELLGIAEEELPADDADLRAWRATHLAVDWPLDEAGFPAGAEVAGAAFGAGPALVDLPTQNPVQERRGGLLNSFHGGDGTTGRVATPPFTVPGRGIAVRVAGGRDCSRTYVGLEVDGVVVERVCGQNDERLRQRMMPTLRHAGKTGRLVFVDEETGPWGHIMADDVVVPQPAQATTLEEEVEPEEAPEAAGPDEDADPEDPAEPWGPR